MKLHSLHAYVFLDKPWLFPPQCIFLSNYHHTEFDVDSDYRTNRYFEAIDKFQAVHGYKVEEEWA